MGQIFPTFSSVKQYDKRFEELGTMQNSSRLTWRNIFLKRALMILVSIVD